MEIIQTKIDGVKLIQPVCVDGPDGSYIEGYQKAEYAACGITAEFNHCFELIGKRGALRALRAPKYGGDPTLLRVSKGAVYDIVLDVRKDSPTFGVWEGHILDDRKHQVLWLPEGIANGYLVLEEDTIYSYQSYEKDGKSEVEILVYNDEDLKLNWTDYIPESELLIQQRDRDGIRFREFASAFI